MDHPTDASSLPSLRYKGYIPGLDGLRGFAILLVLLYHGTDGRVPWQSTSTWLHWALFAASYGASGVQLFYILSGFLISSILLDSASREDYYRKFYLRRALRIMPAYLLMLVILKVGHVVSWKFVLAALLYIANMARLVGASNSEYGSLWSLAVEEQFYLIWPVVVRRCSLKTLTRWILGYFVFEVLLRLAYLFYFPGADTNYKLWFNAEMLLTGALVAICLRRNLLRQDNITRLIWIMAACAALTWPALIYQDTHPARSLLAAIVGTFYRLPFIFLYTTLLLLVLKYNRGPATQSSRPIWFRFLAFFGYISYGLYLVHQLVFNTVDRLIHGTFLDTYTYQPWSLLANTLVCVLISTGLAYLSRRYFEEFFLRRKDGNASAGKAPQPAVTAKETAV